MNRFLEELVRAHPKATYGEMMIKKALDMGAVDTLLISEGMRKIPLTCSATLADMNGMYPLLGVRITFLLTV